MTNNSRALTTSRSSKLKNICNNPACNALIKSHLWINKGIYCNPWCERNFGKNPNRSGKK